MSCYVGIPLINILLFWYTCDKYTLNTVFLQLGEMDREKATSFMVSSVLLLKKLYSGCSALQSDPVDPDRL